MQNKTKYLISILIAALVILSCGKSDKNDTKSNEKATEPPGQNSGEQNQGTSKTDKKDSVKTTGKLEIKWDFRPLKPGQYDAPMTDVYLTVNGKSYFVSKIYYSFNESPASDYTDNKIPADALSACRGWWAGAGIDYWVTRKDNELTVMGREIGETTDDDGNPGDFMGKPFKVVSIKIE